MVKLTDDDPATDGMDFIIYAELMRICKIIDTKNGYKRLSSSYIIKEIENIFSCVTVNG